MPSALPGMDPYLEHPDLWPSFHRHLVASIYQTLLPGLIDRYRARVALRSYASEFVLFTSVTKVTHEEEYLEIRSRADGKLVVVIDVLSLGNRTTAEGRQAYLATRRDALAERASYVEINLLTQGKPPLELDRSSAAGQDYTAIVTRGHAQDRHELYACGLRRRLPTIKVPLAADDRDTVHNLQAAFARAYDSGSYRSKIDYAKPLPADAKLSSDDAAWLAEQLATAE